MYHRKICSVMLVVVMFMMTACFNTNKENDDVVKETVSTITFDEKFLKISGKSPDAFSENIREVEADKYERVFVNDDDTVSIEIKEDQRQYWLDTRKDLLEELHQKFSEKGENYRIEYNDDYTEINYYFTKDIKPQTATDYIINSELYCAMYQLFTKENNDGWIVRTNIYNAKTNKLVSSGDSNTGLSYTDENWKDSE